MKSIRNIFFILFTMLATSTMNAHGGDYDHFDIFKDLKGSDKVAILMVHFGTTHADTRTQTIDAINAKVQEVYSDIDFREAYTSRIIIKRLGERGILKQNPLQALTQLKEEGFTHILVQPTTIINGVEMESLRKNVEMVEEYFKDIRIGNPLLYAPEDYEKLIRIITQDCKDNQAYLFVGHGTSDSTTAQYAMIDYMLKAMKHDNCIVGTIEGYPTYENALEQLQHRDYKKVILIPLMFVAGDHAKNDIAGEWKTNLEGEGYEVEVQIKGLGEHVAIQDLYLEHLNFITTHKKRGILHKKAIYEKTGEVMH